MKILVALIFCIFMGITAISVGVGAAVPSVNLIAKPVVCPNGTMESMAQVFRPYPGKTVTSRTWYCTDEQGTRTELSMFPISMFAGTIYGLGLFALGFVTVMLRRK